MKTIIQRFGLIIGAITAIQGIIAPVLYLMLLDKGISIVELGWLLAILTFFGLALEIPFGTLADNFGRKRIFLLGEAVLLFAIAGFWLADSFFELAFVMALNGTGTALISGTLDALFVEKHTSEVKEKGGGINVQQAQAMFGTFQAVGLAMGSIFAGFLPIWFKSFTTETPLVGFYEINVVLLIPLLLIHWVMTALIIPESDVARSSDSFRRSLSEIRPMIFESLKRLSGSRVLLLLLVMEFLGGMAAVSIEQLWQPQFAQIIDAKSTTWAFGLVFTANFVMVAIGQGVSIPLSRLFGHNYSRMLVVLELLVGALLLLFSVQESVPGFIICYFIFSFVAGATVSPFMAMFHEQVPEETRSTMLSVKSMFLQGGIMIGALIAGTLAAKFDIRTAWRISAAILIGSAFLYLLRPVREFAKELASKESELKIAETD